MTINITDFAVTRLATTNRLLIVTAGLFGLLLLMGHSNGAANSNGYYTGAPTPGGGREVTCGISACHSGGPFGEPQLDVTFAEVGSDDFRSLSEYTPGRAYRVTVAVGYGSTQPAGYGFQAQFLDDAESPATAGELSPGDSDTRVDNRRDGRVYVEHNTIGSDSLFQFNWVAPEAGGGAVNMYVVGNLTNRMGGRLGDNGSTAPTIFSLNEGAPSAVVTLAQAGGRIFPNPINTGTEATLKVQIKKAGSYELDIYNLLGHRVTTRVVNLAGGLQRIALPTQRIQTGVYLINLNGGDTTVTGKVIIH